MDTNPSFHEKFKNFINETNFVEVLENFKQICELLGLDNNDDIKSFYEIIRDNALKLSDIWQNLDKLISDPVYSDGEICSGSKILIVGAGPCGLRMAIECALLGAKVVVVEARNYLSRNNVLHLWPFVIHDIKKLGGKSLFRQFCVGGIDHISIKRLQLVLAKVALLLGVQIHTPVLFEGITEPDAETGAGWRVQLNPKIESLAETDFDVIVGANGKSRCLPDFERTIPKSRLAIAVTANFKNRKTTSEASVQEIGGVNFLYNQAFFHRLDEEINVKLENLVYFKDETHYFVMTVKKESLLEKQVLKQQKSDRKELLARDNVDMNKLQEMAKEVAKCSVEGKLPNLEYALNHHGKEDVAMFDFTTLSVADHACYAKERHGRTLLQCIVGDSLLEPFWPTGTGTARGFLSVFDAAWLIRGWFLEEHTKLDLIANRERLFQLLVQTLSPRLLKSKCDLHTIDPKTRYSSLTYAPAITPETVTNLYNTHDDQERYGDRLVKSFLTNSFKKRESRNVSRNKSFKEYEQKVTKDSVVGDTKTNAKSAVLNDHTIKKISVQSDKDIEPDSKPAESFQIETNQNTINPDSTNKIEKEKTCISEITPENSNVKQHLDEVCSVGVNSDNSVEAKLANNPQKDTVTAVESKVESEKPNDTATEKEIPSTTELSCDSQPGPETIASIQPDVSSIVHIFEDANHNIIEPYIDNLVSNKIIGQQSSEIAPDTAEEEERSPESPTGNEDTSDDSEGGADETIYVTMMGKRDSFDEDDYVPLGISRRLIDKFEERCARKPRVVSTPSFVTPVLDSLQDSTDKPVKADSKETPPDDKCEADQDDNSTADREDRASIHEEQTKTVEETDDVLPIQKETAESDAVVINHDSVDQQEYTKSSEHGTVKDYLKNKIKALEQRLTNLSETLESMEANIALMQAVSSLEEETTLLEDEISTLKHIRANTSKA